MDQEAITIRRTHTPEAAGSSPATGDPAAASRTADEVRQEPTARKELSDPRGRAAECEDGELGWIQGDEGKEGRGGGGRDLRMMRRCGGEGREGGSSSSLADVKGKTRQKPPFPVMRLHSFFTLPRTIRVQLAVRLSPTMSLKIQDSFILWVALQVKVFIPIFRLLQQQDLKDNTLCKWVSRREDTQIWVMPPWYPKWVFCMGTLLEAIVIVLETYFEFGFPSAYAIGDSLMFRRAAAQLSQKKKDRNKFVQRNALNYRNIKPLNIF